MRRGSRLRTRPAVAALAALVALIPAGGASAAPAVPQPDTGPSTSAQARRQARVTAARVEELTAEYRRRQQRAVQAADRLEAAFRVTAVAEQDRERAEEELHRARARQSARIRALYYDGSGGVTLSALTASSPSEALWRVTVGRRIGARVLRTGSAELSRLRRSQAAAAAREAEAERAAETLTTALDRFSEESVAAELVLTQARRHLSRLSAQARRLAEVERAAAELAAAQATGQASVGSGLTTDVSAMTIPADYERDYRASAGRCPGLRWTLLAALGQVESGHGRNNGPSSAGAVGPMQFMPATFARYGVDGDGDGTADPWNHADAIPSAAAYLCASGLDRSEAGVRRALYAYNRAQWYVDLVLATERAVIATVGADG